MPKFSTILQVLLSILGIYLTIVSIIFTIELASGETIIVVAPEDLKDLSTQINALRDSTSIISKKQDEIKSLLSNQQDTLTSMQDSLLGKIALLDTCIDKHFYRVNARLSYIDGRLQNVKIIPNPKSAR